MVRERVLRARKIQLDRYGDEKNNLRERPDAAQAHPQALRDFARRRKTP